MKDIIVTGALLLFALLFYLAIRHHARQLEQTDFQFAKFPSGKPIPEDSELVCFSKEQLEAYTAADLAWLEEYTLMKRNEASTDIQITMWDDLLRRIDLAMNGF